MEHQTKKQLAYNDLQPEDLKLTFAELLGVPKAEYNFREMDHDLNPAIINILLRNDIVSMMELAYTTPQKLLKINGFGPLRFKTLYELYSQFVDETLTLADISPSTAKCKSELRSLIKTYGINSILYELCTTHLPNSDITTKGIAHNKNICQGRARIAYSKIPVHVLVSLKQNGASDEEILKAFPMLSAIDLAITWLYYETHKSEINQDMLDAERE